MAGVDLTRIDGIKVCTVHETGQTASHPAPWPSGPLRCQCVIALKLKVGLALWVQGSFFLTSQGLRP